MYLTFIFLTYIKTCPLPYLKSMTNGNISEASRKRFKEVGSQYTVEVLVSHEKIFGIKLIRSHMVNFFLFVKSLQLEGRK